MKLPIPLGDLPRQDQNRQQTRGGRKLQWSGSRCGGLARPHRPPRDPTHLSLCIAFLKSRRGPRLARGRRLNLRFRTRLCNMYLGSAPPRDSLTRAFREGDSATHSRVEKLPETKN